jgi:peptidoglycan/LPS O-acetylase OafA/YrhL
LLFYLLFPLLILGLRRIAPARLWWWVGAAVGAMVGVQLITLSLIPNTPKSPLTPLSVIQFWFGYNLPICRLSEFVIGSLLALIIVNGRWVPIKIWHALVLCAAGYAAALYLPYVWGFNVTSIAGLGALIGAVAAADLKGSGSFLATRTMRWLGEVSFGFYLCQGVVLFYGRKVTGGHAYSAPVAILVLAAFLVATVLGGFLLFTLVERPMMDRWARPRPKAGVTPVVPSDAPAAEAEATQAPSWSGARR